MDQANKTHLDKDFSVMGIQKVLILVDFSDTSRQALEYGLQLADSCGASVLVQHIYYIPPDAGGDMFVTREAFEGYESNLQQEFEDFKNRIPSGSDRDPRFILSHGDLVDEMNKVVDQEGIDLVIIGNRGGGFLTNILGSNTVKVIHHAHCPVLSIPLKGNFLPIKRIAFATDLKETAQNVFARLINFAKTFEAQVDIIHVREKGEEAPEEPGFLEEALSSVSHTFYYIWAKDIEEGIEQHIQEHHDDLIVLVPRKHPFFDRLFQKSVSRKIAIHAQLPLLSIHE